MSTTQTPTTNTTTTPRDTEELAQFRQRWKEELRDKDRRRGKGKARDVGGAANGGDAQRVTASSSLSSAVKLDDTNLNETETTIVTSKPPNIPPLSTPTSSSIPTQRVSHLQPQLQMTSRLKLALEFYTSAILEEQSGDHSEATRLYRRAFKLDANVDKVHYRQEMARERALLSPIGVGTLSSPIASSTATAASSVIPTNTTAAASSLSLAVHFAHLGLDTHDSHQHHTHSSKIPDVELSHHQSHPFDLHLLLSTWTDPVPEFLPADDRLPVLLTKLPNELVIYIVTAFLPHMEIALIERFALACRKMRILTLDGSIWRKLLELNLVSYQLSDPAVSLDDRCIRYKSDYRRMFIEHPRVRFDGVYIAICHYVRNGLGENPWVTISHLITYRRFLRFLPNGRVMSYQANEDQEISDVIRSLHPNLIKKDLRIGNWQLFGTSLYITDLINVVPSRFQGSIANERYNYQMKLSLKSRPCLGRWNKLDIIDYESVEIETGDVSAFALPNERPYWFSKQITRKMSLLSCPIHLDHIKSSDNPIALPCGHIFCTPCLDRLYEDRRVKPCPLCNKPTKRTSFVKLYIASSSSPLGTPVKRGHGNVNADIDVDVKEGIQIRDALTGLADGGDIDRDGLNKAVDVSRNMTTFAENLAGTSDIELKCLVHELRDASSRFQHILFPQLETLLTIREIIQTLQTQNQNLETALNQRKAELDTISRRRLRMEKDNANLVMAKKLIEEKASNLERDLGVAKKLVDEMQQKLKDKDAVVAQKEDELVKFKRWLGEHKLKAEKYKAETKRLEGAVVELEQRLHSGSASSSQPPPNADNDDNMIDLDEIDDDIPVQVQKKRRIGENSVAKPIMTGRWQPRAPSFVMNQVQGARGSNTSSAHGLPLKLDHRGQAKGTIAVASRIRMGKNS